MLIDQGLYDMNIIMSERSLNELNNVNTNSTYRLNTSSMSIILNQNIIINII